MKVFASICSQVVSSREPTQQALRAVATLCLGSCENGLELRWERSYFSSNPLLNDTPKPCLVLRSSQKLNLGGLEVEFLMRRSVAAPNGKGIRCTETLYCCQKALITCCCHRKGCISKLGELICSWPGGNLVRGLPVPPEAAFPLVPTTLASSTTIFDWHCQDEKTVEDNVWVRTMKGRAQSVRRKCVPATPSGKCSFDKLG